MATVSVSNVPECSICCEHFTTPKVLPCGHTFCLCCLEMYISDRKKTFPCPICQQDVQIPDGGVKDFTTNFIVQTSKHTTHDQPPSTTQDKLPSSTQDQPSSTPQPKCPNHNQREVDYYCNNCNIGLCLKCIFKQHKNHETFDIECDETRSKAIDKLECSRNAIQNRIKNLEKTRCTLLESFEQLKSLCADSCAKVTEKTEKIVSDLRKCCEQIIKDITNNLEDNRSKVEDREKEITSDINLLESNMESNISPSTETTLNILLTLHPLTEKQNECSKDYGLCLTYLQWVDEDDEDEDDEDEDDEDEDDEDEDEEDGDDKDEDSGLDQLGSVISRFYYIPSSYKFLFNVSDIEKDGKVYYNSDKFRNNNLVWGCGVGRYSGGFYIYIRLLPDDNPELDSCNIDGTISLLNIDDDSKCLTKSVSDKRLKRGGLWSWYWRCLPWSKFTDKFNSYLKSNGEFVIQFDITQIREISWK